MRDRALNFCGGVLHSRSRMDGNLPHLRRLVLDGRIVVANVVRAYSDPEGGLKPPLRRAAIRSGLAIKPPLRSGDGGRDCGQIRDCGGIYNLGEGLWLEEFDGYAGGAGAYGDQGD